MYKKILSAIFASALFAVCAPSAMAGAPSSATATDSIIVGVNNFNFGGVSNFVLTGSNTGLNTTTAPLVITSRKHHHNDPTPSVSSSTGEAGALAVVATDLNSSITGVSISDFSNGPVAANTNLGKKASGYAYAADSIDVEVNSINLGLVDNFVLTGANSGFNHTTGGKSETGDAVALADVSTTLNSNSTSIAVAKSGDGSLALNSGKKGGVAYATDETSVEVNNFNGGLVVNMVGTVANTGVNTTSGGSSKTGGALAATSVANNVNSNSTGVSVNDSSTGPVAANVSSQKEDHPTVEGGSCIPTVCGSTGGGPTAINSGAAGTSTATSGTDVAVNNANVGMVTNAVGTVANSGDNTTGGGVTPATHEEHPETQTTTSSSTGDAAAATSVSNTVNSNVTLVTISK